MGAARLQWGLAAFAGDRWQPLATAGNRCHIVSKYPSVMSQEDFDINSLATYLHLTPSQVERMASRDKLPGRKVAGKWRFSQAEIHHWFEDRIGASDEQELVEVERVLGGQSSESLTPDVRIVDLMSPATICLPLNSRSKNSAVDSLCHQAVQAGVLWDADEMADRVRAREAMHPTALENGVALLHPRRPQADLMAEPFLALGITPSGIPFGGPSGTLTDIIFLIGSCDEAGHLRVLARLSRLISNSSLLDQLRAAETRGQVLAAISDLEDTLD